MLTSPQADQIYRVLLDSMTEGVSLTDEAGTIVYTNAAEDSLFGYSAGELAGRHVSVQNAYAEEENQRRVAEVIDHLKEQGRWDGEWLNRRKDGSVFVTSSRITAVTVDGKPHWLCVQRDVTAEREAGQRMRESEARLRLALGASRMAAFDHDLATDDFRHSPDLNRLLGFPLNQQLRMSDVRARYAPGELERLQRLRSEALARGEHFLETELWMSDALGELKCFLLRAESRTDLSGAAVGTTGIVMDLTERRAAESRLRESEERLRLAAGAASIGTWDLDLIAGEGHWDDMAVAISGMPVRQFSNDTWADVVHPEDRHQVRAAFEASLVAGGPAYHVEFRGSVPAPDGGERWLSSHGAVLRDPDSQVPLRAIGIIRDVTTERRAVAALQESEERFRALADSVPSFVWFARSDGAIEYLNDRWYEYTGQEPGEALTDGWLAVIHPDDVDRTRLSWEEARATGSRYQVRCRYRRRDGTYRWHLARAEAVRGPEGSITRWFGTSTDIHEQSEAVERLELALDAGAIQGTWVWDLKSDLVTADDRFADTFGIPHEDAARGFPIERAIDSIHPDDREQVRRTIESAIAEKGGYRCEYRVRNSGGAYRWVEASGKIQCGSDGEPLRFPGVAVDVEARREAEERLRSSQAELRAVYDAVPVGIVIAEAPSGRITGGNAEVERVFGHPVLPSSDVEDYRAWVSFHPDGRQVQAKEYPLSRALRGEEERPELEVLYRRGDGREAWLRLVASPIRDAGGRISGAVVAALDIDNKRRAQQALQQLNESLEAQVRERTAERDRMWRLSTDLMLVATFVGEIEAVNPAWENMLGWSEDQLVGSSFMTLVHPEDVEDTLAEMASLERGVTTFRFTNRYRCADGDYRWISWTAVPGDDRIHAVGRDITSERQAAAELEHAQEALRQSQKLEAMGQLTGGVAHDFNNLLSPIIGGLDLLQRREFGDERAKRTIAGALASAERAKTLVQRLLAFARRQPLQPTAVDVGATIRGMAGLLGSTLGPRIDLRVHIPDELPPARADANQLEMALLNLTVNARDAMPEGGELHIHASHESHPPLDRSVGPGEYVRIVVRDTGKGMDEDTLARCIEPFFSTKGVGQGTGLGLSMVHGLAAQLSGALRIDSVPGQGTSIELWLPTTDAATRETGNQVDAPAIKAAGRALVVDDEELVRASTAEMLEELGYETVEAASASDALGLLEQKTFDLLVTDHLMPGMTGTELAGRVRERFKGTKVLIVSGYAEADGLDPSYTRLTKPFRQAELATALSE